MLKQIHINELEVGMYVHEIREQTGDLKIKSQGKVTSQGMIKELKNKGIVSLTIDLSKQQQAVEQDVQPEAKAEQKAIPFEQEIHRAKSLYEKGKGLQQYLLDSVSKGLPFDISIPEEFTQQLVGSVHRNPNALLCMSRIREKDAYLLEHSLNVAILLAYFGKHMGLPESVINELAYAGFLHDIGKIKVPDEILHKPGRLTEQEMVVMRDHVFFGTQVLAEMHLPEHIMQTVAEHHERLDGYGYPEGKRGDEISRFGRMIAIADTYDAMTADRCYKAGMPSQKALHLLLKEAPAKYDPELVQWFIRCIGVYPVGSLVQLNNHKVGMVVSQQDGKLAQPVVKVFYSLRGNHFLAPQNVDLAQQGTPIKIEKAVVASELGINFTRFFNESIAV